MNKVLMTTLSAFALSVVAVTSAQAATCAAGGITYTVTQDAPGMIMSDDCRSGNDKPTLVGEGWTLGDATDGGGDGSVTLALVGQLWSILNPNGYTDILIAFKHATSFGAFGVDTGNPLTGSWGTLGPAASVNDLSHASVFYKAGEVPPIPLPAAGWLLLAGIGGLAAMRRRRKA